MSQVNLLLPDDLQPGQVMPDRAAMLHMTLSGHTMGTNWSASWFARPGIDPENMRAAFENLFERTILSMSPWENRSLISRFNGLPAGAELKVDTAFEHVLDAALRIARLSGGIFDPCLGGEVMRRGFGATGIGTGADGTLFGEHAWQGLVGQADHVRQPGGVTLDLSAIAKGYAVDQMAALLEARGVAQYLVEIGGEFASGGVKPDQSPWWIDLENPWPDGKPWRLALAGQALATSGDYRQYRLTGEGRVSHIVPGHDWACLNGDLACVSVIADSCADADGWATALFAAGDVNGIELAEANRLKALFQYRNAPPRLSEQMKALAA